MTQCLVWPLHLVLHAVRQFFDFLRFLKHIDRKDVLIRLVYVLFQFSSQLHQFVGIGLERGLPFLVGFLGHIEKQAIPALVSSGCCDSAIDPQRWALVVLGRAGYREPQGKKQTPNQRFRSHGALETDATILPVPKVWPLFLETATKNLLGLRNAGGEY